MNTTPSPEKFEQLPGILKSRFEKNMNRHKGLEWFKVQVKLEANTEKLWSLNEMERTGGETDVVAYDKNLCIITQPSSTIVQEASGEY